MENKILLMELVLVAIERTRYQAAQQSNFPLHFLETTIDGAERRKSA